MKHKKVWIPVLCGTVLVAVAAAWVVYAATALDTIPFTYKVVPAATTPPPPPPPPSPVLDIEVYEDSEMTQPVPRPVPLGDITRGSQQQYTLYVKNTGNQDVHLSTVITVGQGDSIWIVPGPSSGGPDPVLLEPGRAGTWTFTVVVAAASPLGDKQGSVQFLPE